MKTPSPRKIPVINLLNRQRKVKLETESLRKFLEMLASRFQLDQGFSVVLVSDQKIRDLNREFAGKDYPTDVLSFPAAEGPGAEEDYLGDIVISVERAAAQAENHLDCELRVLALHGLLHLRGFDHENDSGEMEKIEHQLRTELNL